MKRISDDDSVSVGAVMLVCHSSEGEAEAEYEGDDGDEMTRMLELEFNGGQKKKKKRRLGVDQVKALEKNFQVENKLDPERKMKLAQDLALHPRQVAVWFQNRRARWKTKQLHRDYSILKSSYDSLKLNLDSLNRDNKALLLQIKDLKSKVESPPSSVPRNIKVDSESDSSAVLLAPNDMSSSASTAQFLKIEEDHNFNFFSDDQPPNLPWYCDHHHWT